MVIKTKDGIVNLSNFTQIFIYKKNDCWVVTGEAINRDTYSLRDCDTKEEAELALQKLWYSLSCEEASFDMTKQWKS